MGSSFRKRGTLPIKNIGKVFNRNLSFAIPIGLGKKQDKISKDKMTQQNMAQIGSKRDNKQIQLP
ncbi:hypothetical protein HK096_001197, partial [Nowakowskiella sp. JEL0078]